MFAGALNLLFGRAFANGLFQANEGTYRKTTKRWNRPTQWRPNGARECARRVRQNAHQRQLNSHKDIVLSGSWRTVVYPTVKPRHIFGGER